MTQKLAKITYKRTVEVIGVIITLTALVVSMLSPEVVDAQTNNVVARVFSTHNEEKALNTAENSFPKVGERDPRYSMWMIATAYSSDPYQTDDTPCIPADGTDLCELAESGIVDAIATNILPLGTKVRFPDLYGDKIFTVRDRMNKKYNGKNRIDFYMANLDEEGTVDNVASKTSAIQFGVKSLKMEIM